MALPAALGLTLGAATLAVVLGGSLIARDRHLARGLADVPARDRVLRAAWSGYAGLQDRWPAMDARVRQALRGVVDREPATVMLLRQTRFEGRLADLGAVDGVGRWVRPMSGRLPRPCRPAHCEVVQIDGRGALPVVPGVRLVRVGSGRLSDVAFGRFGNRGAEAGTSTGLGFGSKPGPPFLVAEGVRALAGLPALDLLYRSYAWIVPLDAADAPPWALDELDRRVTRARSTLLTRSGAFDLTAPLDELNEADRSGRAGSRRLLLIGGEAAALLFAFALLAAAALRRDADATARRLTWFGARRWQIVELTAAECGVLALAATAAGWLLAVGGVALTASWSGAPVGDVLRHSLLSPDGLLLAAAAALAGWLVLVLALTIRPVGVGRRSVSPVDLLALGVVGVVAVGLLRGHADAAELADDNGVGLFLLLLPGLVAFVVAVAAARLLGPALRGLERLSRRGGTVVRLAVLSLSRRPARAGAVVAFLAVSLGLGAFAAVYRATLERNEVDQAAFRVPLDYRIAESLTQLLPVFRAAPLERYEREGEAFPVVRLAGDVSRLSGSNGLTVLGVPAAAVPRLHGWRGDLTGIPPAELGARLRHGAAATPRGPVLPAGARTLAWPARIEGNDADVRVVVRTRGGFFTGVRLRRTSPALLVGEIPPEAHGGRIVALAFSVPAGSEGQHRTAPERGLPGVLTLGTPRADDTALPVDYQTWTGVRGVHTAGRRIGFVLTGQEVPLFRPRQPTDGEPVPAVVTQRLAVAASAGGLLPVRVNGETMTVRVVAAVDAFPGVRGDAVAADTATLLTALNANAPGTAVPNEVWLSGRSLEATAPPFDRLDVESRRELEAAFRTEPLARGALLVLAGTALVALALALLGLALAVLADLRDTSGELYDLEAEGLAPRALRRHVRLRALVLGTTGALGGLALAAVLATLVTDVVALTAGGSAPVPELVLAVDWPLLVLGGAAVAVAAALLVAVLTRSAFAGPAPARVEEAA